MSINPPILKFYWDIAQFVRSYPTVEDSWQLTFLADGIVMRSSRTGNTEQQLTHKNPAII